MSWASDTAIPRGDVMRRLADLERSIREMQAGRSLEASSIGAGGITIKGGGSIRVLDLEGREVLRFGQLPDGTYAMAAYDTSGVQQLAIGQTDSGYGLEAGPQATEEIRRVIGTNIYSATVAANQTRASTSYGDLATVGPSVSDVPVGPSGRALVIVTAHIPAGTGGVDSASQGNMSYEVSGPTNRSPSDDWAVRIGAIDIDKFVTVNGRVSAVSLQAGLTPGAYSFTAKYRQIFGSGATAQAFEDRNLTVIAF